MEIYKNVPTPLTLKSDAPVDIKGHIINNYGLFWRNKVWDVTKSEQYVINGTTAGPVLIRSLMFTPPLKSSKAL